MDIIEEIEYIFKCWEETVSRLRMVSECNNKTRLVKEYILNIDEIR